MKNIGGKVAVITGGASGLGLAMARRFAREGVKLVLADVQQDALDRAVAEFEAAAQAAEKGPLPPAAVSRLHDLLHDFVGEQMLRGYAPLATMRAIVADERG